MKGVDHPWLIEEIRRRWGTVRAHHDGYPRSYPRLLEKTLTLRSGERLWMRPILPSDGPLMREGFAQLSEETIYLRFHAHLETLPDEAIEYLTHVDYVDHLALAVLERDRKQGVGVARYYRREGAPFAEAAVVVTDRWQGKGVGRLLLGELVAAAKVNGVEGFEAFVLSANQVMLAMVERSGYVLHMSEEDDGEVVRVWFRFDERDPLWGAEV